MSVLILPGDARSVLPTLPARSFHTCVTSPPYFGLRDYDHADQLGLEPTPEAYVAELVAVFREVRRTLRDDGTLWVVIGDSYAGSGRGGYAGGKSTLNGGTDGQEISRRARGSQRAAGMHERACEAGAIGRAWVPPAPGYKPKDLIGIPWMVAFALRADGWWLRSDLIWSKPNAHPESVRDRCTKSHEYLFMLSKSARYYFDGDAIAEGLQTDPAERYEQRSRVTGRGDQGASAARGNDRSKSGGYPPKLKNSFARASKDSGGARGDKPQFRPDREPISYEGRRNKRSVWTVATRPFPQAHFATYPPGLIEDCILAGAPAGGGRARSFRRRGHHGPGRGTPRPARHPDRDQSGVRRHGP